MYIIATPIFHHKHRYLDETLLQYRSNHWIQSTYTAHDNAQQYIYVSLTIYQKLDHELCEP